MEKKGKQRITSGVLAKAMAAQDPLTVEVMDRVTTYLSLLVATIANFFDPEMFVIGGGVAEALGEQLVEPIRRKAPGWFIKESDAAKVRIVLAELGDDAGVLGAATLARMRLK
jgi:glucokinase